MKVTSIFMVVLAVTLFAAVLAHAEMVTVQKEGGVSVRTWKFKRNPAKKNAFILNQVVDERGVKKSGATLPTDPPVEQATEFLVVLADYCKTNLNMTEGSAKLWGGGGEWIIPPPPVIGAMMTGESRFGFGVRHQYFGVVINGTVTYQNDNWKGIPLMMGFAAVEHEWMFQASYATFLDIQIINADIGHRSVYTLLVGKPDWGNNAPC